MFLIAKYQCKHLFKVTRKIKKNIYDFKRIIKNLFRNKHNKLSYLTKFKKYQHPNI